MFDGLLERVVTSEPFHLNMKLRMSYDRIRSEFMNLCVLPS